MAGTELDLSTYALGETYQGSLSSTVNECDVLPGRDKCPVGTRWLVIECSAAARLGHGATHSSKTTASTLVDNEAHEPIPADTPVVVEYPGGARLFSSSTASATLRVKCLRKRP